MTGDDGMKGEKGFPGKTLAINMSYVIAELSMSPVYLINHILKKEPALKDVTCTLSFTSI